MLETWELGAMVLAEIEVQGSELIMRFDDYDSMTGITSSPCIGCMWVGRVPQHEGGGLMHQSLQMLWN